MSQSVFMEALIGSSLPSPAPSRGGSGKAESGTGPDFASILRGFMRGGTGDGAGLSSGSTRAPASKLGTLGNSQPFVIPAATSPRIASRRTGASSQPARTAPSTRVQPNEPKNPSARSEKASEASSSTKSESLSRKAEKLLDRLQQQVRDVKEKLQDIPEKDRPPLLDALRKAEGGSGFWSSLPDDSANAALASGFDDPQSDLNQALEGALKLVDQVPDADLQSMLASLSANPAFSALTTAAPVIQPILETLVQGVSRDQVSLPQQAEILKQLSDKPDALIIPPDATQPTAKNVAPETSETVAAPTVTSDAETAPATEAKPETDPKMVTEAKTEAVDESTGETQATQANTTDQTTASESPKNVDIPQTTDQQTALASENSQDQQLKREQDQKQQSSSDAQQTQNSVKGPTQQVPPAGNSVAVGSLTSESAEQPLLEKGASRETNIHLEKTRLEDGLSQVRAESGRQGNHQQSGNGFGQPQTPAGTGTASTAANTPSPAEQVKGSLFSQLVEKASLLKGPQQEKVLTMQLKPEFLGKVDMFLTSRDGAVTARILTDNPVVRDQLEAIAPQIRDHLAEQGIQLQQLTVDISSRQPDDHNRQGRFSQNSGRRSRLGGITGQQEEDSGDLSVSAPETKTTDGKTIDITI